MAKVPRKGDCRRYCAHGLCTSNRIDKADGVKLLPFPKPCSEFISSLIDDTKKHSGKHCPQCSKCIRWIHLCKHAGSSLQDLVDINGRTFICTKHFVNGLGPTEMHPDPFPTSVGEEPSMTTRRRAKARSALQPPTNKCTATTAQSASMLQVTAHENFPSGARDVSTPIPDALTTACRLIELDHSYNVLLAGCCHPEVKTLSVLKSMASSIAENNLSVSFDNKLLTVFFTRDQLVEKKCVIDREMNVQIYVLGQQIESDNPIWQTYPNIWNVHLNYIKFFKDLSDNWLVCRTSINSDSIQKIKERSHPADRYRFDSLTGTIRSFDCALLTPLKVCRACRKMMREIRPKVRKTVFACRKINLLTREEAQKQLRASKTKLSNEKKKNVRLARRLQKFTTGACDVTHDVTRDVTCEVKNGDDDPLRIPGCDEHKTSSADVTKSFFAGQTKARSRKSPKVHRWRPVMMKRCPKSKALSFLPAKKTQSVTIAFPSEQGMTDL